MSTRPAELKMGSDQYRSPCKIICVLCEKSDENEITGPLSSKENISAHQNCLLFASGIYCQHSPTYDDLFGFAVEDVRKERRRGQKLFCHHCKKRGATAGCDVKRCKHSYHYPCAIEARARAIEDNTEGKYILFCELHDPDLKETSSVSLQEASTSGLCGSKRRRSADSHGPRPDRSESNSSSGSSEASLSRKKKKDDVEHMFAPVESDVEECTPPKQHNQSTPDPKSKGYVDLYSPINRHDESPTGSDPVVVPVVSDLEESVLPKQPNQSPPVPENTRYVLCSEFTISNYSLELGSPVSAAPEAVCTSPGFVAAPEHEETPSTSRTSPAPRAPTTDTVSPGTTDSTPERHHDSEGPSGQPGSPQHSRPDFNIEELPEPSSPAGVSTSLDRATASDACDVNSTGNTQSNAVIFWTKCNQAGWTKEIFSALVSQLGSLGERVQSQEASHQGENSLDSDRFCGILVKLNSVDSIYGILSHAFSFTCNSF
ncbi:hypothetical protein PO909_033339 [Leuciscus waleckii]